jgi:DMSO/TMAO reductase YedYZ molybdopterin-dependent catalytic subunit
MNAPELEVSGLVASGSTAFTFDDLAAMPRDAQVLDVSRVMPGRQGAGVKLSALLARAGIERDARHVHIASIDPKFAVSLPIDEIATSGIILYCVGGAPIDASKGGPFRLLVPGHADECVHVKGVAKLHLAAAPGRDTRPKDDAEHAKLHAKKKSS